MCKVADRKSALHWLQCSPFADAPDVCCRTDDNQNFNTHLGIEDLSLPGMQSLLCNSYLSSRPFDLKAGSSCWHIQELSAAVYVRIWHLQASALRYLFHDDMPALY